MSRARPLTAQRCAKPGVLTGAQSPLARPQCSTMRRLAYDHSLDDSFAEVLPCEAGPVVAADPRVHPSSYAVLFSRRLRGVNPDSFHLELRRVVPRTSPRTLPFELSGILIRWRRSLARPMSQASPIPDVLKHLPVCETYEVSEGLFFVFALGNPHFSPHSPSA